MTHRHTVSVYVRNRDHMIQVLQVLREAEEQGDLDFPFDVRTETTDLITRVQLLKADPERRESWRSQEEG
jgi:hypothetical protein